LTISTQALARRALAAHGQLDYWESGMDLGLSSDWFTSFVLYQRRLRNEFRRLQERYGFETVNANRSIATIQRDLRTRIQAVLAQPT
jgi:dTMP kinase